MRSFLLVTCGALALGLISLAGGGVSADSAAGANGQPVFHIQQMDKDVPVDQFAGPGIRIHKLGEDQGGWRLPTVKAREEAFYQAGLRPDISSWDQLDRDMLYLRARDTTLGELTSRYPKLAKGKLKSLHKLLARRSQTGSQTGSGAGSTE